jgi:diguanylate cyclase (GGDEF)-like protein
MRRIPPTLMLSAAVTAVAVGLLLGPVRDLPQPGRSLQLPWPFLAALFGASVILRIHLQFRREVHSVTLMELPLVLGLHFVDPMGLVLARLAGSVPALVIHSRQRGSKLLFNVGLFALEACVAALAFSWLLAGRAPAGTTGLVATFGAVLATDVLSAGLVIAAISLQEGFPDRAAAGQAMAGGAAAAVVNTSLAMIAVAVLATDRQVAWLLLVLAGVLFIAYQAYASLREQHERSSRLHHFSRVVARPERLGAVTATILAETQVLMRAERAELIMFPDDRNPLRTVLDAEGQPVIGPTPQAGPVLEALRGALAADKAVLLVPPIDDQALREALLEQGIRDAMVAPLLAGGIGGTLVVANRLGDVGAFGRQDLLLLQTLVGQAGVALARAQLIDDLHQAATERERQALHDPLTGLPNRTLFTDRVRQAAAALGPEARLAVLLIDLDRFKEINDTLGHASGNLVLREVAVRLRAGLPESYTIARLGGDEFAVLAPALPDWHAAVDLGRLVRATLARPLPIEQLELAVTGSIGIALGPDNGIDPDLLLQRADVAMYQAKEGHTGIEAYTPERDQYSPRRLALVGALRTAIEQRELTLRYQPKVELASGRMVGAEALLRWNHPQYGAVPPDEFIPIAESTGLIQPLGQFVLETALDQARGWQEAGMSLGLAVNLSVRNLLEPTLVERVAGLIARSGIAPGTLTLEITESGVMTDPAAAIAVLSELRRAGVRLSIDDFGTGYSSLAYLKRLPVDEVKLDKSFVLNMTGDAHDAAIVRSTIELAHNLGLQLVAEGVEDQETLELLATLGCDLAQGYHLARPMSVNELADVHRRGSFMVGRPARPPLASIRRDAGRLRKV